MFSINRPLVSTKLLRLPTRGALGNGLRVVAGAVVASNGSLTVITRNVRLELRPERDGSTTVVSRTPMRPSGRNPCRDRLRPRPAGGRGRAPLGARSAIDHGAGDGLRGRLQRHGGTT